MRSFWAERSNSTPYLAMIFITIMQFLMLVSFHYYKIFKAIVNYISVNMVNNFFCWIKPSTKITLHYKYMFFNVSSLVPVKAFRIYNSYISVGGFNSSRFIIPSIRTHVFLFECFRYILLMFFGFFSPLTPCIFSFSRRTHFLFSCFRHCDKSFFTFVPRSMAYFRNCVTFMRTIQTNIFSIRLNPESLFAQFTSIFNHNGSPFRNIITQGV